MKHQEPLTHSEIMTALTDCLRDIMRTTVTDRTMPLLIARGRAVSSIVTSAHREQILEAKRTYVLEKVEKAREERKSLLKSKQS